MSRPLQPALPWQQAAVHTSLWVGSQARIHTLLLLTLTCIGLALRLQLLSAFPLREDEAVYSYWARSEPTDPFFLHVWPDKPPLFLWTLSGAFALLGPSDITARLVSIFAGTATIPLVAIAARRLWRSPTAALIAALLLTLNPYAVSFASTAYTDSLLVLFGTGAVALALGGQGVGAGLLLGAACMTKQQGVFYIPLVFALLWSVGKPGKVGDRLFSGLLGAALIVLPILLWDSQRWAVAPSPWALAQQNYTPLIWLSPQQWPARAAAWAEWLWYLGGSWTVWSMFFAAGGAALVMARRRPRLFLALAWGLAFVVVHLITSIQVWDRYLLPLAPWLAWVVSGPLALILHLRWPVMWRRALLLALMVGMVGLIRPGVDAAQGRIPIGGDHGDYAGLDAALAWLEEQIEDDVSSRAILYHQALGWHFRFYLYDELQARGDDPPRVDLRWFPSAAYLADNAAKAPYPPKYLIVPDWATPRDLALHLALRGLSLEPRLAAGRFAVLEVVQPPRPLCDWCMSQLPAAVALPFKPQFEPPDMPSLPIAPQLSTP